MKQKITSADNYTILKDIWDKLDNVDRKMDERFERIEARVNILEGFKMQVLILVSVGIFVSAFLKDYVTTKIMGKG